jgi:hypothetical protein
MTTIISLFNTTARLNNSASILQMGLGSPTEVFIKTSQLVGSSTMINGIGSQMIGTFDYISGAFEGTHMLYQSGTAVQFGLMSMSSASLSIPLSWQGDAIQLGIVRSSLSEMHNHDQISLDNPSNSLEGGNTVEWDVFPIVPITPSPIVQDRDMTRYHKAYSFTRSQPVRIRLIKR